MPPSRLVPSLIPGRLLAPARPRASLRFPAASCSAFRSLHNETSYRQKLPSQQPDRYPPPCHRRRYHSSDHPPPSAAFSPTEQAILAAAYCHVPEHGFSQQTLALGARDAGYLDISAGVLPDGVFSLIRWHLVTQRKALARRSREQLAGGDRSRTVEQRVEWLAWERLMGNREILGRWQEALAIMAQPSYVPASLKELAMLADEICFLAGDVSVDPSWYTKRASLSAIYATSELFMTSDKSPGFEATRNFLRRRLGEASGFSSYVRAVGQWAGFTASAGVNVLRSKGVRI